MTAEIYQKRAQCQLKYPHIQHPCCSLIYTATWLSSCESVPNLRVAKFVGRTPWRDEAQGQVLSTCISSSDPGHFKQIPVPDSPRTIPTNLRHFAQSRAQAALSQPAFVQRSEAPRLTEQGQARLLQEQSSLWTQPGNRTHCTTSGAIPTTYQRWPALAIMTFWYVMPMPMSAVPLGQAAASRRHLFCAEAPMLWFDKGGRSHVVPQSCALGVAVAL